MKRARKVEVVEKRTAYQGYFRIDSYRLRHELHAGGMSAEITREVFERGHAVGVLPYDPVRRKVVIVEQFRIGAYAAGFEPWLTEIVAGIIDPGETPEEVARREVREEAGLAVSDLILMRHYLVSPGGTSESTRVYLARVDTEGAGGIHGLAHENEDIRVWVMDVAEALKLLDDNRVDNALTVVALQWLALYENKARESWGFPPA